LPGYTTPAKKIRNRIKQLGKKDYLVCWQRPVKPDWMDRETYDRMPASLTLRQIEVNVEEPGFRVQSMVIITTLTDTRKYSMHDIGDLYHQRWQVELDIRAIKCNLGMDVLRGKSPEMVRKEIWTCLLAYNLIRKTMLQAAMDTDLSPRQLSFTSAMQSMAASWVINPTLNEAALALMITTQIRSLTSQVVGNRPNRVEPRAVKRRPKPIRLLNMVREKARELLLQHTNPFKKRK